MKITNWFLFGVLEACGRDSPGFTDSACICVRESLNQDQSVPYFWKREQSRLLFGSVQILKKKEILTVSIGDFDNFLVENPHFFLFMF